MASLIWGSIGMGFFVYGKKQKAWVPALGGIALMGASYFISSAWYMSITAIALIVATVWFRDRF